MEWKGDGWHSMEWDGSGWIGRTGERREWNNNGRAAVSHAIEYNGMNTNE